MKGDSEENCKRVRVQVRDRRREGEGEGGRERERKRMRERKRGREGGCLPSEMHRIGGSFPMEVRAEGNVSVRVCKGYRRRNREIRREKRDFLKGLKLRTAAL